MSEGTEKGSITRPSLCAADHTAAHERDQDGERNGGDHGFEGGLHRGTEMAEMLEQPRVLQLFDLQTDETRGLFEIGLRLVGVGAGAGQRAGQVLVDARAGYAGVLVGLVHAPTPCRRTIFRVCTDNATGVGPVFASGPSHYYTQY